MHQCGEGIHWDYVFNQCDFPVKTFCFSGVSIDHIEHIIPAEPEHIESEPEPEHNEPEHNEPEHNEPEHNEPEPENNEAEPEQNEPEFSTVGVTGPIAIASIEPPTAAPIRIYKFLIFIFSKSHTLSNISECPGGQAFIADPKDCHRYYICIGGIPIITSCPERMAWDKDLSQCNEEAWEHCID